MEFLEKERELRRLQIEKELVIASAEESEIKQILKQERLSGDKDLTSGEGVKRWLRPDVGVQNIQEGRSYVDPLAPPFIPRSQPTPASKPSIPKPAITPHFQDSGVNTTLKQIVSLQAKHTELSSLLINQQQINHLPVKEPPVFSGDYFKYPAFVTAFDSIISKSVPSNRERLFFLEQLH